MIPRKECGDAIELRCAIADAIFRARNGWRNSENLETRQDFWNLSSKLEQIQEEAAKLLNDIFSGKK